MATVMRAFIAPVHLMRTDDDWCSDCAKPSVKEGPVVHIDLDGAEPWGTLRWCSECNKRDWIDLKGTLMPVKDKDLEK